jgi:hypothetical protein
LDALLVDALPETGKYHWLSALDPVHRSYQSIGRPMATTLMASALPETPDRELTEFGDYEEPESTNSFDWAEQTTLGNSALYLATR